MRIEFDPALAEAVVSQALRRPEAAAHALEHRNASNALYAERNERAREDRFARLHLDTFERLGHAATVASLLHADPAVPAAFARAVVLRADQRRDEEVDVIPGAPPSLKLRLLPARFFDRAGLAAYLGRQLVHVADLVDPSFGYLRIERLAPGPAEDALYRDRYRLFWELTVAGRLERSGRNPESSMNERRRLEEEFNALYGTLLEGVRTRVFDRLHEGPRPQHRELLACARDTRLLLALAGVPVPAGVDRMPGSPCPLCRFPTHAWRAGAPRPEVAAAVGRDFPAWDADQGMCERCADVYEAPADVGLVSTPDRT